MPPQSVKVGFKISIVEIRSLPLSLAGQPIHTKFIFQKSDKKTQPMLIGDNGVVKFAYEDKNAKAVLKFFSTMVYESYGDKFCSKLCQFKVVLNENESIAQGMFDLG